MMRDNLFWNSCVLHLRSYTRSPRFSQMTCRLAFVQWIASQPPGPIAAHACDADSGCSISHAVNCTISSGLSHFQDCRQAKQTSSLAPVQPHTLPPCTTPMWKVVCLNMETWIVLVYVSVHLDISCQTKRKRSGESCKDFVFGSCFSAVYQTSILTKTI